MSADSLQKLFVRASVVCAALLFAAAVSASWTGPTAAPPGNNVAPPVNTSSNAQTKAGNFTAPVVTASSQFCLGASCITAWPGGGGADNLGNHTATQSLNMNGNAITNAGGVYTNDWFRVNSGGGIYWQSYGGGWTMSDTTWVRSYQDKSVYTGGQVRADSGFCIGTDCRSTWQTISFAWQGLCTTPVVGAQNSTDLDCSLYCGSSVMVGFALFDGSNLKQMKCLRY